MAEQELGTDQVGRRGRSLDELRQQRSEVRQSQTYKRFLKDLCERASFDEAFGEKAAVSVLCALEQRIMEEEAKDLEAQLPRKLVGLLQRCERHEDLRPRQLNREKFVELVSKDLGKDPGEAEQVIRAVFQTLREKVTEGEVDEVIHQLPADLRDLWQAPA
jgi:uncharacterized protein (DUF2267 family)